MRIKVGVIFINSYVPKCHYGGHILGRSLYSFLGLTDQRLVVTITSNRRVGRGVGGIRRVVVSFFVLVNSAT